MGDWPVLLTYFHWGMGDAWYAFGMLVSGTNNRHKLYNPKQREEHINYFYKPLQ